MLAGGGALLLPFVSGSFDALVRSFVQPSPYPRSQSLCARLPLAGDPAPSTRTAAGGAEGQNWGNRNGNLGRVALEGR